MNPKLKETKSIHSSKYLSLFETTYELNNGKEFNYLVASRKENYKPSTSKADAVTLFVIDETGEHFLLTKEFRYPVNSFTTSTPAGLIDDNEDPIDAAIRELEEETGFYEVLSYKELPATYSSVGMTDERVQPVILRINSKLKNEPEQEEIEFISHRWITKEEAKEIATNEETLTARCQLALLLFTTNYFDNI